MATNNFSMLPEKQQQNSVNFATNSKNDVQYSNLNLNQNNKSSDTQFLQSSKNVSLVSDKEKQNCAYDNKKVSTDFHQTKSGLSNSNFTSTPLKLMKQFDDDEKKEEQKRWKKESSNSDTIKNSSTLSLHISAYENSVAKVPAVDSDDSVDGGDNKSCLKEEKSIKKWKSSLSSDIQDTFGYARQQEEQHISNPEVMQFKTSQKLANPRQSTSSYQQGAPSRKPFMLSQTDVKREGATLRFRELWELLPPTIPNRHPLHSRLVSWLRKNDRTKDWEDCLRQVTTFDSIEGFWSVANHFIQPSDLSWGSDFYVFREGIKLMLEDGQNVKGGRWLIMVDKQKRQQLLDHSGMEKLLALVGEQFGQDGDEICGAVVNIRSNGDKATPVKTSSKEDAHPPVGLGQRLQAKLDNNMPSNILFPEKQKSSPSSNRLSGNAKVDLKTKDHRISNGTYKVIVVQLGAHVSTRKPFADGTPGLVGCDVNVVGLKKDGWVLYNEEILKNVSQRLNSLEWDLLRNPKTSIEVLNLEQLVSKLSSYVGRFQHQTIGSITATAARYFYNDASFFGL